MGAGGAEGWGLGLLTSAQSQSQSQFHNYKAHHHAQNVICEKNQSLNFLRLGSRIDVVASRLETAMRMYKAHNHKAHDHNNNAIRARG